MDNKSQQLSLILTSCREGDTAGQKRLYELFYSYGMSVALRFVTNRAEAQEVLNDAFYKVFSKLHIYDDTLHFKPWFRKIIVHTAIDYQRKFNKVNFDEETNFSKRSQLFSQNEGWTNLNYEEVLKKIQQLPPAYKLVFNLYAIEGYKHREIAEQLGISIGASKSNYARARSKLQEQLSNKEQFSKGEKLYEG